MTVGAACGIIYEYLLAHYSGRILGSIDVAIFGIIGIMVASMGLGAFFARTIKNPFTGFAWLEALISALGGLSILLMSGAMSYAFVLPAQLEQSFGLDPSIAVEGGAVYGMRQLVNLFPYLLGALLGFLIGMEIPFIARIREIVYSKHLTNNAGTVYGMDYIGGGIGALIWIFICLKQPIIITAAATALLNLLLGAIFCIAFRKKISFVFPLILIKSIIAIILVSIFINGTGWVNAMNNALYKDNVVYSNNTRFQNLVITERKVGGLSSSILNLYINGRLQFSTADEKIYHSFLTVPALLASARQDNVLMIGGGDGLALRDVLRFEPQRVTLVDIDPAMINLFRGSDENAEAWLNSRVTVLNENSLSDPRVQIVNRDAFIHVEGLVQSGVVFDVIIVDLPDPSHPDLNKLYSAYFYRQLYNLLSGDGAISIQSTSPYHSKKAFLSIGLTVKEAGFDVDQYHSNIPSFGEWGWTIGTKQGQTAKVRISSVPADKFTNDFLSKEMTLSSFVFSKDFFKNIDDIEVNRLTVPVLYNYHSSSWIKQQGVYHTDAE